MAIFFRHHQMHDGIEIVPIGRRAGLFGLASYATMAIFWVVYMFLHENLWVLGLAGLFSVWAVAIPWFMVRIDKLPKWKKLHGNGEYGPILLFRRSLEGRAIIIRNT